MVKKGIIEEIFSKARFADDPRSYKVIYRDFETLREVTLSDFIILRLYLLLELNGLRRMKKFYFKNLKLEV